MILVGTDSNWKPLSLNPKDLTFISYEMEPELLYNTIAYIIMTIK